MTHTADPTDPSPHAAYFVDALRLAAGLEAGPSADRTLEAFRSVPREPFAGPARGGSTRHSRGR